MLGQMWWYHFCAFCTEGALHSGSCTPWWWTIVKVMMEMECLCNRWWTWRPSWPMQRKRSTLALQPVTDALPRSGSPVHRSATHWAVTAAPSPRWSCTQSSPSCCQPVRTPPSRSAPQHLWAIFFFTHMRQESERVISVRSSGRLAKVLC